MCKYKKGPAFVSIAELAYWLSNGKSVYLRDKYIHNSWVISMQFRYLMIEVKRKIIYRALENEDGKE